LAAAGATINKKPSKKHPPNPLQKGELNQEQATSNKKLKIDPPDLRQQSDRLFKRGN
jgi:hypothetical protein